jgi:hypothetical protein
MRIRIGALVLALTLANTSSAGGQLDRGKGRGADQSTACDNALRAAGWSKY